MKLTLGLVWLCLTISLIDDHLRRLHLLDVPVINGDVSPELDGHYSDRTDLFDETHVNVGEQLPLSFCEGVCHFAAIVILSKRLNTKLSRQRFLELLRHTNDLNHYLVTLLSGQFARVWVWNRLHFHCDDLLHKGLVQQRILLSQSERPRE